MNSDSDIEPLDSNTHERYLNNISQQLANILTEMRRFHGEIQSLLLEIAQQMPDR